MSARPAAAKRGYSQEWAMFAADYRARYPWCICCWTGGAQSPTEIVDHIVPLAHAPERLFDPTNLQPVCHDCHDRVKRQLEARWRAGKLDARDLDLRSHAALVLWRRTHRPAIGLDGFAIDGT